MVLSRVLRQTTRWAALPVGAGAAAAAAWLTAGAPASTAAGSSFYDVVETTSDGKPFAFEQMRGSVVYGVNVASR